MAFSRKEEEKERNEGMYTSYIGKPVRIISANPSYGPDYGVVEHTNYEKTVLRPCIIDEPMDGKHNMRLEDKVGATIDTKMITKMEPLSEGYIEKYMKYINSLPSKDKEEEKE